MASLLSIFAIILLVGFGLPPGHSAAFNYTWTVQYSEALSWSDPFPRYLPGLWDGLGGHDFFFYAPLPFWFVAVFVAPLCPGCAPSTEFVLGSAIMLVASGFSMFVFLRAFFGIRPAAFGAAVYVVLPYHLLIDWFDRQSAGEFTSYAFLPLIALGMERMRRREGGGAIMAIGIAGLTLSHLPMALLAAHVFAVVAFVFVVQERGGPADRIMLLVRFTWFAVLGLAIASFYWLPAVMLLEAVSPASLFDPFFQPWQWLHGNAVPKSQVAFSHRILISFLACLPLLLAAARYAHGPTLAWIWVATLFAVVMNTAVSEPVWRTLIISQVQFPWRLMAFVDFAASIAAAVIAARAHESRVRQALVVSLIAVVAAVSVLGRSTTFTQPDTTPELRYPDQYGAMEYFSPEMTGALQRWLNDPDIDYFDQRAVVGAIAGISDELRNAPQSVVALERRPRLLTVQPSPGASVASLPIQYWFLWKAETASGIPLEVRANPTFGTLDVLAPANGFSDELVTVSLPFHSSEVAGGAASLLALLALIASLLRRRLRAM